MTRNFKTALNKALLEEYREEHNIPYSVKLGIYGYWVSKGYRPRKGEPAKYNCKLWTKRGFANCWLWSDKQVNKMEE